MFTPLGPEEVHDGLTWSVPFMFLPSYTVVLGGFHSLINLQGSTLLVDVVGGAWSCPSTRARHDTTRDAGRSDSGLGVRTKV